MNPIISIKVRYKKLAKLQAFRKEFEKFKALSNSNKRFIPSWNERAPMLDDKTEITPFDHHYVLHILLLVEQTNKSMAVAIFGL